MKKTLTYCFGSLLCLMTLASCQNGGSCCGGAATDVDLTGRLYPKVKTPTKSLVIVDLQNDDIEGQVAAIGLQGIVNRDSEQKDLCDEQPLQGQPRRLENRPARHGPDGASSGSTVC